MARQDLSGGDSDALRAHAVEATEQPTHIVAAYLIPLHVEIMPASRSCLQCKGIALSGD